jgi:hypothetical protein
LHHCSVVVKALCYKPEGRQISLPNLVLYHFEVFIIPPVDRLCGLVVRVLRYRSGDPGSVPGTTRK